MATYRYHANDAASLLLNERPVYGSARLGSLRQQMELLALPNFDAADANPVQNIDLNYELTDHLGNVCAVVTGRLLDGNGSGTAKQGELVSAQGYEPFGSLLPGRNFSSDSYRNLFQGMEHDDEFYGSTGTSYTTEFRQYDPRIGRWLSIDPLASVFPHQSPYCAYNNNPIYWIDPTGQGGEVTADKANKTITVNQKVFFWKNKEGANNDQVSNQEGLVSTLQASDQAGWNGTFNVDMSDAQDGSDMWTVNYNTEFVPIEATNEASYERQAKRRQSAEPTADWLSAINDPNQRNGDYTGGKITINLAGSRPTVQTYGHERAHTLGLREAAQYPQFGLPTAGPNMNGRANATGPITSYAAQRSVQLAEVRLQVQTFYSIIQQSENTIVRIGFFGAGRSSPADPTRPALPFERK